MEALSGAAQAAYRRLIDHPDCSRTTRRRARWRRSRCSTWARARRAASAPARSATCARFPGSSPGRRTATSCPAGTAWAAASSPSSRCAATRGAALLRRMFRDSRLFRLIVDEVEKTLSYVDLDVAREYAELVPEPRVRDAVFAMIEEEYHRTVEAVLRISGARELAERFPALPPQAGAPAADDRTRSPGSRSSCCAGSASPAATRRRKSCSRRCCCRSTASRRGSGRRGSEEGGRASQRW